MNESSKLYADEPEACFENETPGDRRARYLRDVSDSTTGTRRKLMEIIKAAGSKGVDYIFITDPNRSGYTPEDLWELRRDGIVQVVLGERGDLKAVFHEFAPCDGIILPGDHIKN